jgi:glyoxylase-like metal-dependent hydrolase (beta-lactamase superfamily II)
MLIQTFPAGPLGCNCSVVVDPASKTAVVIDPGGDLPAIRAVVEQAGAKVTAILHTHTHVDHVGCTAELQEWAGAPARIHEKDRPLYEMLPVQAALLGIRQPAPAEMDGDLLDGGSVGAGAAEITVLHTPGHTPGSVSFLLRGPGGAVAFTGDTLFRRSVGRTDLWGGDSGALLLSVKRKLLTLDDATRVVPGHGPETTIGEEKLKNPFLKGR